MAGLSVLLACLVASCMLGSHSVMGNTIQVGGRDGWVVNPSETYDHWAQRLRFQVNDSLVFNYKDGSNSVLQVKKTDYDSCDASNPLKRMSSGSAAFQLDRSGPFYFISGNKTNCLAGQKLVVVVLQIRSPKTPITLPPSSSASPALPPASPVPSLPPASPVPSLPPSPAAASPELAPQLSPASSPSPISATPSLAPQPSPASSPSPISATPSLAPQPSAASPESPPSSSPAPSYSDAPAGAPGASPSSPPALPGASDQISPADSNDTNSPKSSSAWRGVAGSSPAFVVVVGLAGLLAFAV